MATSQEWNDSKRSKEAKAEDGILPSNKRAIGRVSFILLS